MELKKDEELSAFYRGALIQKTIDVELRMDVLIGRFLSMNNQDRVIDLIEIFDLTEISFSAKTRIVNFIVKKYFNHFLKENPDLFADLEYVMKNRNILAHRRPDLETNDFLKLSWAKSAKNSIQKTTQLIDDSFYAEFKEKCSESYVRLIFLENEISKWTEKSSSSKSE